ncbi:MAG: hypothetical protein JRD93_14655 [Deltaproteobacteria bacterium]|nr:hypothetical protein [Deltaproteobacteria bacterium]
MRTGIGPITINDFATLAWDKVKHVYPKKTKHLVVKIIKALHKKPQQTTQQLCNSIETDDDLLVVNIMKELQKIKFVKHDGYVLTELEGCTSPKELGIYSINGSMS